MATLTSRGVSRRREKIMKSCWWWWRPPHEKPHEKHRFSNFQNFLPLEFFWIIRHYAWSHWIRNCLKYFKCWYQHQPHKAYKMAQLPQIAPSKNWKPCFSSMSQKSKIVFDFFPTISDKFLDASSHLYKRVCPLVRRSVRPSVTLSWKVEKLSIYSAKNKAKLIRFV